MDDSHRTDPVKLVRKRLDADGVRDHVSWLTTHARNLEMRIKGGMTDYSEASDAALAAVAEQLIDGTITAVQVSFVHEDAWWSDTLMRVRDSYRLVRMKQLGSDA